VPYCVNPNKDPRENHRVWSVSLEGLIMHRMETGNGKHGQIGASIHPGVLIGSALWNLVAHGNKPGKT
jgi:hypothetical protein